MQVRVASLLKLDAIKITVIMEDAVDNIFVKELSSSILEFHTRIITNVQCCSGRDRPSPHQSKCQLSIKPDAYEESIN